jgi:hypothetical protein
MYEPLKSYSVESGPLKITIFADTAYEAALEAVRWWDAGQAVSTPEETAHRAALDAAVEVRKTGVNRICRMFPTFNLLARASGETASEAWDRLLRQRVAGSN